MTNRNNLRLIETDIFPFEFLSQIAERESWRKEIHRPLYHVHKWWAKRLGSVFRGILLGCALNESDDLEQAFYRKHSFNRMAVFDPFMGSGTTLGEAHKLGFAALGRDINPVAVEAVRVALGPIDQRKLESTFSQLSREVGDTILALYRSTDSKGSPCDVLYYFWVMQANCPGCSRTVDLFSSHVVARNAYPERKPEVQIVCPSCGGIFPSLNGQHEVWCPSCGQRFNPEVQHALGANANCNHCRKTFPILRALGGKRPKFRMYGKLVLTGNGDKEYLPATEEDQLAYQECSRRLQEELENQRITLPSLSLQDGYNTKQAMSYGFTSWKDFFNDRQLLSLGYLLNTILKVADRPSRDWLFTLFSGVLEFNNMFASYKGEGTGAVRHMFSHHVLKPERMPIEANVWGTPKSSGSFSGLFRTRLLRAIGYRQAPTEVNGRKGKALVCALPFSGIVQSNWPACHVFEDRAIYISCGDSADTALPDNTVDLVVTDPPFFDNVHYSELADFFFSWQQLAGNGNRQATTRSEAEVQDSDAEKFAKKLQGVLRECHRILKDDGLLVFTYHHSRDEGWKALADAVIGADFVVINSHPVKSEMSVATPKAQAKEPIQLDIILVCRKAGTAPPGLPLRQALECARAKLLRLQQAGFSLSQNDRKVVVFGQMLATLRSAASFEDIARNVEGEVAACNLKDAPLFRTQSF